MLIKLWATVFCLVFFSVKSNGQFVVNGAVKDSLSRPISYATVTVINSINVIKGFTLTDGKGYFSITLADTLRKAALTLQASSLGYKKERMILLPGKSLYEITLSSDIRSLAPVTIQGERIPIKIRGDTITYNAKAFSSPNDKVLEDILRKMPGIRVGDNGKLSYNGKPIANLYLDGDNLLDDKYAIGTKNIPNTMVDKVQVLDNHQPINALVGKVYSNQVDINIIFRDSARIKPLSQAQLGAGLPGNYDGMLNTMWFKGNYKAINYIKANNVGVDLSAEVNSFNLEDKLKNLDVLPPDNLLSVSTIDKPSLPVYRYLFNHNTIINLNNLVALNEEVKLKLNLYYVHDRQQENFRSATTTYLPGDTISYTQRQSNTLKPDLLHASINLNLNKKGYYINNNFTTDIDKQNIRSQLNANGIAGNQQLNSKVQSFSNDFNYIGSKKEQIFELYSHLNYIRQPQTLTISPGPDSGFFNNGVSYTGLQQSINTPAFFTNNYITFGFANSKFQQLYKIGISTADETLTSGLAKTLTDGALRPAIDSAVNDLNWQRNREYFEGEYNWLAERVKVSMHLPLNFQQIKYDDSSYHYQNTLSGLIFNPSLNIKISNGPEDFFGFSYRYSTEFGNINDIYRGSILTNFRSLYNNSGVLTRSGSHILGFNYNFVRGLKLLFLNLNATYTITNANTINTTVLNDNFEQRVILPFQNRTNSFSSNLSFSKLLFDLQTTLNVRLGWQFDQTNNIVNSRLLGYNNYITSATLSTDSRLTDLIFLKYYTIFNYFQSTQRSGSTVAASYQRLAELRQKWELDFETVKNLNLKLVEEFYYNQQILSNSTKYFFADATAQYKLTRQKVDLEASMLNIFNVNTFDVTSVSSYAITDNSYKIRGRMAIVKILFNF